MNVSLRKERQLNLRLFVYGAVVCICIIAVNSAVGSSGQGDASADHGGAVIPVLLSLLVVILAGRIGGDIAIRLRQPEVLGELVIGVVIGNLVLFGFQGLEFIKADNTLKVLSELGVILLLFEVGLETSIKDMMRVGLSSLLVAVLGVVAPFALGWGVGIIFLPEANPVIHAFLGATLCATSVGITARVLKDLGKIQTGESKIILGAAVIDDVLGLLMLAIIGGVITASNNGESLEALSVAKTVGIAVGFLLAAIILGRFVTPMAFRVVSYLKSHGVLLVTALAICFGLSYLAALAELAPIVGAFTAGLILDPISYEDLKLKKGEATIEELIAPISALLVPLFFVLMGAQVNLAEFARGDIIGFAICLTLVAIIGKQICSFGVLQPGVDKLAVGLGMIPRGEVGLIFAGYGISLNYLGQPVVNSATYGAVVFMVIATTMATPPLITWRFNKIFAASPGDDSQAPADKSGRDANAMHV